MLCAKCATPNIETARFCVTCGEAMHLSASSPDAETSAGMTKTFEAPVGASLLSGSILAGRYRIVEAIGVGGMGAVYKAVDLELEVPVALKVIRSEYAGNEKILERFKKEITIARKITHKNVARIHDFGESEGIRYISMEYIEGRDLAHIIEKEGALPVERVVAILKQCCSALAEAHAMGVVHRDLKPHNVMIDPKGDVHLMDFGIALSQETKGLTRTGAIVGTPEYMSPEQAEGKKVDHRADVYSLGITLYEAMTGVVPFSGATQWEVIRKHIQDRAKPPRRLRQEIPAWLETIILKCLEKDPAHRYQEVTEIVRDIDRQKATRTFAAYVPQLRPLFLGLGVVVLVAVAIAGTLFFGQRRITAGPGGKRSLAILPFENQTGKADLDWMRTGLAENLATDLGQSKYLRVTTRERLAQIMKDLGLSESAAMDGSSLAKIGEYAGVQAVVTGSFVGKDESLRINLRVQDPKSGEAIGSIVVPGREADVLAMIDQLTLKTKEILSVTKEQIAADTDQAIASARTGSVEAASLYQKGVDLIYAGKNLDAVAPLEQAVERDPDYALAWARLSQAYRNLGYDEKAKDAGQKALSKVLKAVDRVTPSDRAFVRAEHAAALHDGQEAIDAYEEILKADPYDATAAYNLGLSYENSGAWDKAEVFYRKAIEIDKSYAAAFASVGRIKIRSGHPEESLKEFEGALAQYRKIGSKEGEATVYQAICNAHIGLRQWSEALTYCGKSASIKEVIGDKRGLAASLESQAYVYQVTGRLNEAFTSAERVLALRREIGDAWGTAAGLTNLGSIYEDRGQLRESLKSREEALGIWRTVQDQAYEAEVRDNLGGLKIQIGDLAEAEKDLAAAADLYQSLGNEEGAAQVSSDRALLLFARGDLSGADGLYGRALDQWKALESSEGISETQYRQSALAIARGRYGTAERLSRQSLADYEKAGDKLNAARCRVVLASALLRSGESAEAMKTIETAGADAQSLGNNLLISELETLRAEAAAAGGGAAPKPPGDCPSKGDALPGPLFTCAYQRARALLASGNPSAVPAADEAVAAAEATGARHRVLLARALRALALGRVSESKAAAEGAAVLEEATRSGAGDVVLRIAPPLALLLSKSGQSARGAAAGEALLTHLQAARTDLQGERLKSFLERGIDPAGCRAAADLLRQAGKASEAERLSGLLRL